MSKVHSPQRKKELSYERDRRNTYGQHAKGSRKRIPRHKRELLKSFRRKANQLLAKASELIDPAVAEVTDMRIAAVKRKQWVKHPDIPLSEIVPTKIQNRAAALDRHKNRRESRRV